MALERAPSKQMTLAEIYDWIVANIPFFKDKGDHNSSIGWKNSIRHNLSLHDKFSRKHDQLNILRPIIKNVEAILLYINRFIFFFYKYSSR